MQEYGTNLLLALDAVHRPANKEHAKPNLPTHVIVNDCECLEKDSIILLEQIRTLDKQRLQEYIGTFDRRLMMSVDKALPISIGVSKKD